MDGAVVFAAEEGELFEGGCVGDAGEDGFGAEEGEDAVGVGFPVSAGLA